MALLVKFKWPLTAVVCTALVVLGAVLVGEGAGWVQPGALDRIEAWATGIGAMFGAPLLLLLARDENRNGVPDLFEGK